MSGVSAWVYAVCLPLSFAHPVMSRLLTGCVTATAFGVWYGWALLTVLAHNCPC